MGALCNSSSYNSNNTTKQINYNITSNDRIDRQVHKLLLLGSGSSGKSTLFKQLKVIHSISTSEDIIETTMNIRKNLVFFMLKLLTKSAVFADKGDHECHVDLSNIEISKAVHFVAIFKHNTFEIVENDKLLKLGSAIHLLWSLPAIHKYTYSKRYLFSIADNMNFFFNKCQIAFDVYYIPSFEDILRCRIRTAGMNKIDFMQNSTTFSIFDVGGQRSERCKWFNFFDSVTAVVFVAALNAYHSVIFEDETKNAMHESLDVFSAIVNNIVFLKTDFVILLNKNDLFEENLRNGVSLNHCFSIENGWKGIEWQGCNYIPCNNLKQKFIANEINSIDEELPINNTSLYQNSSSSTTVNNGAVVVSHTIRPPSTDTDVFPMLPTNTVNIVNAATSASEYYECGGGGNNAISLEKLNMLNEDEYDEYYNKCYIQAIQFIQQQYKLLIPNIKEKSIFMHITDATHIGIVRKVFYDVQCTVVRQNLSKSGLVPP